MFRKYESGLSLVVENNSSLRSVTVGIMVRTGSAYETPQNNGISHFMEHMQFKGTKKRSAEDIVRGFEEAGASYNAATGKEYTTYYFKSIDEKTEECFDILTDIFLNSEYPAAELERERKVVLEEINMSRDEPDGVCYDLLYSKMFDGALGMEILGTKENVSRFTKADLEAYRSTNYLPANTLIGFVGNITEEEACALVEKYMKDFVERPYAQPPQNKPLKFSGGYVEYIHDYEQSELSLAFPGVVYSDERAVVELALDGVLGTGLSSRLAQTIREKMGLCYSVYSSIWRGRTNGVFSVCVNVSAVNAKKCLDAIRNEIDLIVKDGITEKELEKVKTQIKVNAMFGKESPMSYMLTHLVWRALSDTDYDLDKYVERVNAITVDDVNALAREIFSHESALAYVGKPLDAPLG